MFNQDPIYMMECDDDTWMIRAACAKVVEQDNLDQANKMKQGR